MADPRVTATPAALRLLERMEDRHGRLVVHISGGCCDGSSPMCLRVEDLPQGPHDARLGTIGRSDIVIDTEQYDRWGRPAFALDVTSGPGGGFSLDALEDAHLTLSTLVGAPHDGQSHEA